MSNIKYGLISETDARTLEKVVDLVLEQFPEIKKGSDLAYFEDESKCIKITEVGLFNCGTANGLMSYLSGKTSVVYIGIDNEKNKPVENVPEWMNFIKGNSSEVYNQIPDNSQHLIIIDACHTFPAVVADFFCYAPKVKVGGYICFHDTGKHIDPLSGWQGVGDKNDPDMCLGGVRKALKAIGLFGRKSGFAIDMDELIKTEYSVDDIKRIFNQQGVLIAGAKRLEGNLFPGWELIFDEADPNDEAGGFCCFRKLY